MMCVIKAISDSREHFQLYINLGVIWPQVITPNVIYVTHSREYDIAFIQQFEGHADAKDASDVSL